MSGIPHDLLLDELPGPKRGQAAILYYRDEIVWGPGGTYFALAYTIAEASMMNEIGCVLWASFDGRTRILGNLKGHYACCWDTPWCIWLDQDTFVLKAQYSDGNRRHVPLVVVNASRGCAVLPGTDNVEAMPASVRRYDGPFARLDKNLLHAVRDCG